MYRAQQRHRVVPASRSMHRSSREPGGSWRRRCLAHRTLKHSHSLGTTRLLDCTLLRCRVLWSQCDTCAQRQRACILVGTRGFDGRRSAGPHRHHRTCAARSANSLHSPPNAEGRRRRRRVPARKAQNSPPSLRALRGPRRLRPSGPHAAPPRHTGGAPVVSPHSAATKTATGSRACRSDLRMMPNSRPPTGTPSRQSRAMRRPRLR